MYRNSGKTCSEIKLYSPQATSGSYVIDLDGEGARLRTIHRLLWDDWQKRSWCDNCRSRRSNQDPGQWIWSCARHVHYIGAALTNVPQLTGLLDMSAHCKKFIKYECYDSALLYMGNLSGWWVSRDLEQMTYWGGASPSDSYKCACGVTNSRADSSRGWQRSSHRKVSPSGYSVEIWRYKWTLWIRIPHGWKTKVFRNCIGFKFTISVIQYTVYNDINDVSCWLLT